MSTVANIKTNSNFLIITHSFCFKMTKPLSRGVAEKRLKSVPYAGITRIRFKGLISARKRHPYIQLSLTVNMFGEEPLFLLCGFRSGSGFCLRRCLVIRFSGCALLRGRFIGFTGGRSYGFFICLRTVICTIGVTL